MRFWNLTWAIPATMGIAVIWAFSAIANYDFGMTQGTAEPRDLYFFTISSAQASGMASLAVDLLKAVLPAMIVVAWMFRQWTSVVGGLFCFLLCLGFSAQNSIGFALTSHIRAMDERGQTADQWAALRKTLETTQKTRDMVPEHRPVAVVDADIAAKKADARFGEAKGCAEDVRGAIVFCREYRGLTAEKAAADSAAALDDKLEKLRGQLDTRKAVSEADPMAGAAALLGWKREGIAGGRSVWLTVLVETLSAVGWALIWGVYVAALPRPSPAGARTAVKGPAYATAGTAGLIVAPPAPVPAQLAGEPIPTEAQEDEPRDPPPPSSGRKDILNDRGDLKRKDTEPVPEAPAKQASVARLATVNGQKVKASACAAEAPTMPRSDADLERQTVLDWIGECVTATHDRKHAPSSGDCHTSLLAFCERGRLAAVDQQRMTQIMTESLKPEKVGNRYPRNAKERIWPGWMVEMPTVEPLRASA